MEYVLSGETAQKLRDLIGDKGGTPALASAASRQRQICTVRCSTWDTGSKTGTGQVGQIDAGGWEYFGSAADMLLLTANNENLTPTKRYPAIRYGEVSGQTIFVAFAPDSLGCGFTYDEDGNVVVDVEGLAGDGLTFHVTEEGCTLDVDPGCHITLSGDKVGVDVEGLVGEGNGLEAVGEGSCKTLGIKQGCGITLDGEGGITFFSPDAAGAGLESGETPCELAVKVGCGLLIDEESGALTVDVEGIAGDGLTHHITEDGCTIDVVAGCAITLEGGTKVSVDVEALAGTGLTVEGEGTCKKLAVVQPSYAVVAGVCLGQGGTLLVTFINPATGETWCVETPPCCGDPFPDPEPYPDPEPPPPGTGIVTVSGGAWGTPAPLTGDVTTSGAGLVTTISSGVITNAMVNASAGIADTKLGTISTSGKVLNSATTATSANTASAIVARDGSGNFSAGTITANLTGNASGTAASITGNLTGNVTSVGMATTIASGVITNAMVNASAGIVDTKLATISTSGKVSNSATTATNANTASAIVARDGSGNFSAGTITAALTGNVTGNVSGTAATFTGSLTGDVTSTAMATTIAANAVTDTKLRDSIPLSVIGRGVNSTGDPGDIQAGTDGHVLRRVSNTLVFAYPALTSGSDAASGYDIAAAGTASGAYSTITGWGFTAPTTGTYVIMAAAQGITAASAGGNYISIRVLVNGGSIGNLPDVYTSTAGVIYNASTSNNYLVGLTAGDAITVQAAQTWTGTQLNALVFPFSLIYLRVA